jgi:hypothetical protein
MAMMITVQTMVDVDRVLGLTYGWYFASVVAVPHL